MTDLPTPMKHHQPGWELTLHSGSTDEVKYTVWAPGPAPHDGFPNNCVVREHWRARVERDHGWDTASKRSQTLDDVLRIFPDEVADLFTQVIGND